MSNTEIPLFCLSIFGSFRFILSHGILLNQSKLEQPKYAFGLFLQSLTCTKIFLTCSIGVQVNIL